MRSTKILSKSWAEDQLRRIYNLIQLNSVLIVGSPLEKEEFFRSALHFLNSEFIFSPNTKDAFLHVKSHPSLIIVDFEELNLKAIEFCNKVKAFQIYQKIPMILVSVSGTDSHHLSECGADAFLTTPLTLAIFQATVKSWLRVIQSEREKSIKQAKVNGLTNLMMKRLQASEAEANSAVKSRDLFLSIASHELKTPISALKMQVQMGQRAISLSTGKIPSPEKLEKIFAVSSRQVDRLTKLVDDLLDVSRIEAGKLSYSLEKMNLSDLVQETSERYVDIAVMAKSKIEMNIESEIVGLWDRFRMEQVVTNLLSNAVKYGDGGVIQINLKRVGNNLPYFRFKTKDWVLMK